MNHARSGGPKVTELHYEDERLGTVDLPARPLEVLRGIGSGLTRRPGDPPGTFWGVGDRGPNLKVELAVERFGLAHLAGHADRDGAKVMPCPEIGPALSELRLEGDRVVLVRSLPLRDRHGAGLSGLPLPAGEGCVTEPGIAPDGRLLPGDPAGADTEGLAAGPDGTFVVGDEYGPSLLHLAADGQVLRRWVPAGLEPLFAGANYPIEGRLPAIAAQRRLNRGFEALTSSTDGQSLFLAFQSPLAHPDERAHREARHVRLWQLDACSGTVVAEFLYPLDPPESFRRDAAQGRVDGSDIKVSELLALDDGHLLVLERASATTKLYKVRLDPDRTTGREHLALSTRPTLEERSARGELDGAPFVLDKAPVLTTDELPEVGADLEGMVLLSPRSLLLVNDNDFGVEGVRTRFWRIDLPAELF